MEEEILLQPNTPGGGTYLTIPNRRWPDLFFPAPKNVQRLYTPSSKYHYRKIIIGLHPFPGFN
jgi:hypothetical protein